MMLWEKNYPLIFSDLFSFSKTKKHGRKKHYQKSELLLKSASDSPDYYTRWAKTGFLRFLKKISDFFNFPK
jgi:hypothetical protein